MENELFSKHVFLDTYRQVGVTKIPHGVALEGITYYPETGETGIQRIIFSEKAATKLSEILQEWVNVAIPSYVSSIPILSRQDQITSDFYLLLLVPFPISYLDYTKKMKEAFELGKNWQCEATKVGPD